MDANVVIGRLDAQAHGFKRYFTGNPCVNGHIAERRVSSGICLECESNDGFTKDPPPWKDDGGAHRVPIYDLNVRPARLVRRVGWTNCLSPISER